MSPYWLLSRQLDRLIARQTAASQKAVYRKPFIVELLEERAMLDAGGVDDLGDAGDTATVDANGDCTYDDSATGDGTAPIQSTPACDLDPGDVSTVGDGSTDDAANDGSSDDPTADDGSDDGSSWDDGAGIDDSVPDDGAGTDDGGSTDDGSNGDGNLVFRSHDGINGVPIMYCFGGMAGGVNGDGGDPTALADDTGLGDATGDVAADDGSTDAGTDDGSTDAGTDGGVVVCNFGGINETFVAESTSASESLPMTATGDVAASAQQSVVAGASIAQAQCVVTAPALGATAQPAWLNAIADDDAGSDANPSPTNAALAAATPADSTAGVSDTSVADEGVTDADTAERIDIADASTELDDDLASL